MGWQDLKSLNKFEQKADTYSISAVNIIDKFSTQFLFVYGSEKNSPIPIIKVELGDPERWYHQLIALD